MSETENPYSGENLYKSVTTPMEAPDWSDPLKMRASIYKSLGIGGLQSEFQGLNTQLRDYDIGTSEAQLSAQGRPVSMSKITGIKREIGDKRSLKRQGLASQLQAKADLLTAYMGEAQTRFSVLMGERDKKQQMMMQYPGASIKFTDSWGKVQKRLVKYEKQAKKDLQKQAYKDALLAMGKSTKGLSRNELKRKLKKANKEVYKEARETSKLQLEQLRNSIKRSKQGASAPKMSLYGQAQEMKARNVSLDDATYQLGQYNNLMPGSEASEILDYIYNGTVPSLNPDRHEINEFGEKIYFDKNNEPIEWEDE